MRAALARASGDLDPARHWYPPSYPLLGAPFVGLTPAQPFYLPDLACLLNLGRLFTRLATRPAPGVGLGGRPRRRGVPGHDRLWSSAEPGGRWTDGTTAELRFRVAEPAGFPTPVLQVRADAFVPSERHPVRVTA